VDPRDRRPAGPAAAGPEAAVTIPGPADHPRRPARPRTTPDTMPLTAADCPLLPADSPLIDLYNQVEAAVKQARDPALSPALDPDRSAAAERGLAGARALLTRERYRIGFLGGSGMGKSATLNNVVRRKLASGGGEARAATSVVSRFFPSPPGTPPRLRLEYMTLTQFQQRRYALARCIGGAVKNCAPPDPAATADDMRAENVRLITELEGEIEAQQKETEGDEMARVDARAAADRKTLLRLLKAFQKHGRELCAGGPVPNGRPVPLSDTEDLSVDLYEYTNHQTGGEPNDRDLIWQIMVWFPTENASHQIELIDLPGVGTERDGDDLTTLAFLDQLDGALMFRHAGKATPAEFARLITALNTGNQDKRWEFSEARESLRERIWMVVTHADQLNKTNYGQEGNNKGTFLDGIADQMATFGIPQTYVRFVANGYHNDLAGLGPNPSADAFVGCYKTTFRLAVGPDGSYELPPKLAAHPVLRDAFQEVLRDGGIERLRRVITSELADKVRRLLCRHAARNLANAAEDLRSHAYAMSELDGLTEEHFLAFNEWATRAKYLSGRRVGTDPANPAYRNVLRYTEAEFEPVRAGLRGLFAKAAQTALSPDPREQHQAISDQLDRKARLLVPDAIGKLFARVLVDLAEAGVGQPPVVVEENLSPPDLLRGWFDDDRARVGEWALGADGPLAELADPVLFPVAAGGGTAEVLDFQTEYKPLVYDKIDVVVHDLAHRAGGRVRLRLRTLCDRLGFLSRRKNKGAGVPKEKLQALARALAAARDGLLRVVTALAAPATAPEPEAR